MSQVIKPVLENRPGTSILFYPHVETGKRGASYFEDLEPIECPECRIGLPHLEHGDIVICTCGSKWVRYGAGIQDVVE